VLEELGHTKYRFEQNEAMIFSRTYTLEDHEKKKRWDGSGCLPIDDLWEPLIIDEAIPFWL